MLNRRDLLKRIIALPALAAFPVMAKEEFKPIHTSEILERKKEESRLSLNFLKQFEVEVQSAMKADPPLVKGPQMTATEVLRRREQANLGGKRLAEVADNEIYRLLTLKG